MNLAAIFIFAMSCQQTDDTRAAPSREELNHVVLWKNDALSARLMFKPTASIADRNWIALELENHTQQPIELGQTWISLTSATNTDGNQKSECGISLAGTMPSIKNVPPGRHRFDGNTLQFASTNIACPGTEGRVDVLAKISTATKDGRNFETAEGTTFSIAWYQPTEQQLAMMLDELKKRFFAKAIPDEDYARIVTLLKAPAVVQGLTVDDYLSALRTTRDWNLRYVLLPLLFVRHAENPMVLQYYHEMFQKDPDRVYQDSIIPSVWNAEFLEPLVQGCEQGKWGYFMGLSRHVQAWRNDKPVVLRVSAALLKHHAILRRDLNEIPDNELETWARAVREASYVPDPGIVKLLKPALDDQRQANIDVGSMGIDEARVCDRALVAILQILDGDSMPAFKAAGIAEWKTREERRSGHNRMIEKLKARLEQVPAPAAK